MNHFIFLPLVYFLGTANCDITDDLIADSVECRQDFLAIKDQCKFSDHLKVCCTERDFLFIKYMLIWKDLF